MLHLRQEQQQHGQRKCENVQYKCVNIQSNEWDPHKKCEYIVFFLAFHVFLLPPNLNELTAAFQSSRSCTEHND